MWDTVKAIAFAAGALLGTFLGGVDALIYTLLAFVVFDYITGVIAAAIEKALSSEVGWKGIAKKIFIFILVGLAHLLDTYVLGGTAVLRTACIFFYIANEGLSIIENASRLGLPIPAKLKDALEQLRDEE